LTLDGKVELFHLILETHLKDQEKGDLGAFLRRL
jgi:hypothetical protein